MQRVRATVVAVVATAVVAGTGWAASPRQMRVRDEPNVSGPLAADPELHSCQSKKTSANGEVVAVFRICLQWYRLAPQGETDPEKNYGALWIKARAKAKNGWCARRVKLETVLPSRGTLSKAPRPGKKIELKRGKEMTSSLKVDAQGAAPVAGVVEQSYIVRPGAMRVTFDDDTRVYRMKWEGTSTRAIAFAKGIELRWPDGGDPWVPSPDEAPAIFGRVVQPSVC